MKEEDQLRPRQVYDEQFKAKVALEAIKGEKTIAELASQYSFANCLSKDDQLWMYAMLSCGASILVIYVTSIEPAMYPEAIDIVNASTVILGAQVYFKIKHCFKVCSGK
jgi:hypothetical protein